MHLTPYHYEVAKREEGFWPALIPRPVGVAVGEQQAWARLTATARTLRAAVPGLGLD